MGNSKKVSDNDDSESTSIKLPKIETHKEDGLNLRENVQNDKSLIQNGPSSYNTFPINKAHANFNTNANANPNSNTNSDTNVNANTNTNTNTNTSANINTNISTNAHEDSKSSTQSRKKKRRAKSKGKSSVITLNKPNNNNPVNERKNEQDLEEAGNNTDHNVISTGINENDEDKSSYIKEISAKKPTFPNNTNDNNNSNNTPLSPRKQAIMRYKKSDDKMNERSFLNEAKENMRNKKKSPLLSNTNDEDDKYSSLLAQQNMDGKASLLKFESSKILVYHEQLNGDNSESQSSGRLLGHGEFEIFQLHNGDVTYLSCGRSFVYPLLPKLKILRIAFNQFILPLVNPERYWKIFINTDDDIGIHFLESTLKKLVQYRNLYFASITPSISKTEEITTFENIRPDSSHPKIDSKPNELQCNKDDLSNSGSLQLVADGETTRQLQRTPDIRSKVHEYLPSEFADVPESPPSAPISPNPIIESNVTLTSIKNNFDDGDKNNYTSTTGWALINREKSMNSITSAIASLEVDGNTTYNKQGVTNVKQENINFNISHQPSKPIYEPPPPPINQFQNLTDYKIHHPRPTKYQKSPNLSSSQDFNYNLFNKHKLPSSHLKKAEIDEKSESSMDSLLDEYEENISISKSYSFSYSKSRPPSRSVSSKIPANYHYNRTNNGHLFKENQNILDDLADSQYADEYDNNENIIDDNDDDQFPATSLSEYIRTRNNDKLTTRSRRSSRSELYTSVSNWMEPALNKKAPAYNKAYSVSNGNEGKTMSGKDLNDTYKNIYKSITQRNLSQYLENDTTSNTRKQPSRPQSIKPNLLPTTNHLNRKGSYADGLIQNRNGNGRSRSGSISRFSDYSSLLHSQSYYPLNKKPSKDTTRLYKQVSSNLSRSELPKNRNSIGIELNSSDVYKLISSNRTDVQDLRNGAKSNKHGIKNSKDDKNNNSRGFASRLFGW